ncbi:MAG: tRNA (adenine(22)-N(1))-methyltransferase [Methylocystaceae bacterium]
MDTVSPRISALADWAVAGKSLADIGSDHAWLAVDLLVSSRCPQVVVTDINPLPLKRAKNMITRWGLLDKCDFRLGDGLEPLKPGEVATVCIAGMGGQTMAEILQAAEAKLPSYERLLLQPMNVFKPLRQFLSRSGYPILRERTVREGAGCFIILEVGTRMGRPYDLTDLEAEVGPYVLKHPGEYDNCFYLRQWYRKYNNRLTNMARSSRTQVEEQRQQLELGLEKLKGVLNEC